MEALDIEANGNDGMVRLNITPVVLTTEVEYITMTECVQPSKYVATGTVTIHTTYMCIYYMA